MLNFILGLVIGLAVAWNVDKPAILANLQQKLFDKLKK
jgi:hypothetical protein